MSQLGTIERKVFGALVILADDKNVAKASLSQIAKAMGYKRAGGALTFALKTLEFNNHIQKISNGVYRVYL
jgi:hypothetical protein